MPRRVGLRQCAPPRVLFELGQDVPAYVRPAPLSCLPTPYPRPQLPSRAELTLLHALAGLARCAAKSGTTRRARLRAAALPARATRPRATRTTPRWPASRPRGTRAAVRSPLPLFPPAPLSLSRLTLSRRSQITRARAAAATAGGASATTTTGTAASGTCERRASRSARGRRRGRMRDEALSLAR